MCASRVPESLSLHQDMLICGMHAHALGWYGDCTSMGITLLIYNYYPDTLYFDQRVRHWSREWRRSRRPFEIEAFRQTMFGAQPAGAATRDPDSTSSVSG